MAQGKGTKASPWKLTTPPGTSDYTMYHEGDVIFCTVGKTVLQYNAAAITDTVAMLKKHGDWVLTLAGLVPVATNTTLAMGAMNNGKLEKSTNICPWSGQVWSNPAVDNTLFQEILIRNTDPEQAWKDASGKLKQIAETWKEENPTWKPAA